MVSAVRKCLKISVLCFCGELFSTSASAITQEIRATYVPDPANPQSNKFINQTPQSGYAAPIPTIADGTT